MYIKKEDIKNIFKKERIPHAILFEGSSGEERFKIAIYFAKNISCTDKNGPCENCIPCQKIEKNVHPDVKIVSKGESVSIKIDQIRDLRAEAFIIPNENFYKIFIVEDVNLMTVQAQNAFIKILEEPPKRVVFVLLCDTASSLLATIRSRVQIYNIKSDEKLNKNDEIFELVEILTVSIISNDKLKLLENLGKIPNNRPIFKTVLEKILEGLIKKYELGKNILEKIEVIKYILSLIDKNANFNLMISFLCVNL